MKEVFEVTWNKFSYKADFHCDYCGGNNPCWYNELLCMALCNPCMNMIKCDYENHGGS